MHVASKKGRRDSGDRPASRGACDAICPMIASERSGCGFYECDQPSGEGKVTVGRGH